MKLFDHQKKIIAEDKHKTGFWLGTGSAKTAIALHMAKGRTLVICPKTQFSDQNWQREVKKWNLDVNLIVISKETFRKEARTLKRFDTVIVDECHTVLGVTPNVCYRNKQAVPKTSQLFEELQCYLERTRPDRLYLLTATIIRSPMTVWGAGVLLKQLSVDTFYSWRSAFYVKLPIPRREAWVAKKDSDSKNRLALFVNKIGYTGRLSDYFDVPDQSFKTIYLDLNEKQKARMKELPMEYPEPIVLLGKKHQLENGVLAGNEYQPLEVFDNAKIDTILELALEFPRMVLFAKYTAQIAQIATALRKEGYKVLVLEGATKDRGELLAEANASDACVFIAQAQVSSGWELPDYPVMVFASMSYSVVDRIQAEGRILRANALKKNLYINLVIRGGVDEAVAKCITEKQDFNERIYLNLKN